MIAKRLEVISELVTHSRCTADIGTDHGIVPLKLIDSHRADKVIATDVSAPSLNKTQKKVASNHLDSKIITRLGNGLDPINKDECDTIIIAGMGGLLIKDILNRGVNKIENATLILQPMNNAHFVRMFLEFSDYKITKEMIVFENNHYYQIIVAEPGNMKIDDPIDYWVGCKSARKSDAVFENFIKSLISKQKEIIHYTKNQPTANARRKIIQTKNIICMLEEILK